MDERFGAFAQNTVGTARRGRTKNAAKRDFRGGLEATARTADVAESAALQCADAATTLTAASTAGQRVEAAFFRGAEFGVRSECAEIVSPFMNNPS